jgi:hypothetical protein
MQFYNVVIMPWCSSLVRFSTLILNNRWTFNNTTTSIVKLYLVANMPYCGKLVCLLIQ